MMEDANHLRMLSIGYYVYTGLTALFSGLTLIYMAIGGAIMTGKIPMGPKSSSAGTPHPDQMLGGMFFGIGLLGTIMILAMAVLSFLTARWISARKHPVFCMVVAGLSCLNMPLGTLIGVFTFIVLMRPSVQDLFRAGSTQNNFTHH